MLLDRLKSVKMGRKIFFNWDSTNTVLFLTQDPTNVAGFLTRDPIGIQ